MFSIAVPAGAECGKTIAHGKSETLPQSSPLTKFAILPRKIPGVHAVATMSAIFQKETFLVLAKHTMESTTPMNPPWLAIPPFQIWSAISGFDTKFEKS